MSSVNHVSRVSIITKSNLLLGNVNSNTTALLRAQQQLSSGLRISRPSEDPASATAIMSLDATLERQSQYLRNMDWAKDFLDVTEGSLSTAVSLNRDVHTEIMSVMDGTSDDRASVLGVVDSIIEEMVRIGNQQYLNSYIFGGQSTTTPPFEQTAAGVVFNGDLASLSTRISSSTQFDYTINAQDTFGVLSEPMALADLNPDVAGATLLTDVNGALDQGVRLGSIRISDGTDTALIDLSSCVTMDDVARTIEAAGLGGVMGVYIEGNHFRIDSNGADLVVEEVADGFTARDLGIHIPGGTGGADVIGLDLDARLTLNTPLSALNGGAGVDTSLGFTIRNSGIDVVDPVDLTACQTVDDLINAINHVGAGALAGISADGSTLELYNTISGSAMSVYDIGGTSASDLGFVTSTGDIALADLNKGRGLDISAGANDLEIHDSTYDEATGVGLHEINLDGCTTLNDVVSAINTQCGGAVTAAIGPGMAGITITDNTAGAGPLTALTSPENYSANGIAEVLGLADSSGIGYLSSGDLGALEVEGIFSDLLALKDALSIVDDTEARAALTDLGASFEANQDRLNIIYGRIGAESASLETRRSSMVAMNAATEALRSDLADIDFTEAITNYQSLLTALESNLTVGGQLAGMTLLDYLR